MKNPNEIALGPFFTTAHTTRRVSGPLEPLNIAMEWSNSRHARRIDLFRTVLPFTPELVRLSHLVFHESELPCLVEYLDYSELNTSEGVFLPLDALLAALFRNSEITRSVFHVMNDLAAAVPFRSVLADPPVPFQGFAAIFRSAIQSEPKLLPGLLVAEAEARGFRLGTAHFEKGLVHAHIDWEPKCGSTRFWVCPATFRPSENRVLDTGKWAMSRYIGASQILAQEFHRLVPGNPHDLLSEAGINFLQNEILRPRRPAALPK